MPITVDTTSPVSVEALPLDGLTTDEMLTLLDRLWESIDAGGPRPAPAWHLEIVRQRKADLDAGKATLIPWEYVRDELLGEEA